MLTERQKEILKIIVLEYIKLAKQSEYPYLVENAIKIATDKI